MEKAGVKTRDISFFSQKNGEMVRVHSKAARDYAKFLENQDCVKRYEAGKLLELERFPHISPAGIRKLYFNTQWSTDFFLHLSDGRKAVRELVRGDDLKQQATVERLELSRRYWAALNIFDWKIVVASV
ncbi:MAG: hypothetical protein NC081_06710 [Roseburia sp.]|nr:hypothetical protein [Roseburia sp.]